FHWNTHWYGTIQVQWRELRQPGRAFWRQCQQRSFAGVDEPGQLHGGGGLFRGHKLHQQHRHPGRRTNSRRGELPKDLDLDFVLDALYGPIYMRFLVGHGSVTPEFVDQLCEQVLTGASCCK
ncbi:MAG: TetR-like C-terminal domain-containing protein, partial [Terriglobales bacterium]